MALTRSVPRSLSMSALALSLFAWSAGAQTFAPTVTAASGVSGVNCVVTADFNLDGHPDVAVIENGGNRISWVPKTAAGFGPSKAIASGLSSPWHAAAFDLDGDGDLDALCASRNDSTLAWYENIGSPSTMVEHFLGTHATAFEADAADLHDDGDLDIFVAAYGDSDVVWYEGLGGGNFGPSQVIDGLASGARYVHTDDLDGDDDPDVLCANFSGGNVTYYENLLPTKKPKVFEILGLNCVESGRPWCWARTCWGAARRSAGSPCPWPTSARTAWTWCSAPRSRGGCTT